MALPSEEEKAFLAAVGPEAKRVVEATRAEMRDREIALRSPCQLPRDAPDSSALPRVPASPKKAMGDALKPLGYEYRSKLSGHGTYYLTKRSASNNLMHIHFDAGCFGLGGQFRYEGPLWQATVTLPLPPGVEYVGWRYLGQEVLDHACRKAAVAVEYLEKTFVPALDAIYGPAPAWFEYPH